MHEILCKNDLKTDVPIKLNNVIFKVKQMSLYKKIAV